ncbi:MAG: ATP-grasp domain-containing protein, partial [Bacteroidota bacterium]|nr:ATP-grasp domain-containing protein [Bacteroidota bacterium]
DPLLQAGWEKDYVLMEYLPGDELTVDCFSDRHGVLRFTGPRKRHRTFGGISVNSFTIPISEEIRQIAEIINNRLQLRGLWFFQVKQNVAGDYKLLEVSVRTAGTMNLYRNLGVNFPLLTIYDLLDYEINIICNDYYLEVDRALFNRYRSSLQYDTIYIDFDDTITKNKLPNPFVMMFLFNARNNGKCIKVITRHEFDFDQTLHELGIHKSLFTEVIHLDWTTKKYLSIKETKDVIFIDNAYVERAEVHTHLGIPVFDVDAIQSLINWKE